MQELGALDKGLNSVFEFCTWGSVFVDTEKKETDKFNFKNFNPVAQMFPAGW